MTLRVEELTKVRCRGCGRAMVWATTASGKRLPLDPAAPVFAVTRRPPDDVIATPAAQAIDEPLFLVSHFSFCPESSAFSRTRGESGLEALRQACEEAARVFEIYEDLEMAGKMRTALEAAGRRTT